MKSTEPDWEFVHRLRVRYSEVDQQGVVFNGHWLNYFDVAISHFFEAMGDRDPAHDWESMVVHTEIDWKGPARTDDWIDIAVAPTHLGTSSYTVSCRASIEGVEVCRGSVTYVTVVLDERRSRPIPDSLRAELVRTLR